jgi:hypothetical protein
MQDSDSFLAGAINLKYNRRVKREKTANLYMKIGIVHPAPSTQPCTQMNWLQIIGDSHAVRLRLLRHDRLLTAKTIVRVN